MLDINISHLTVPIQDAACVQGVAALLGHMTSISKACIRLLLSVILVSNFWLSHLRCLSHYPTNTAVATPRSLFHYLAVLEGACHLKNM